jgi:Cytochrome C and Quinol oxidase polypeptide I
MYILKYNNIKNKVLLIWGFVVNWVFSTNHKVIGGLYFIFAFISSIVGAMLSFYIRITLTDPSTNFLEYNYQLCNYQLYNVTVPGHTFILIFFLIVPALVGGFGNWYIPLLIGAPNMAFPRMNNISFWLLPPSLLLLVESFLCKAGVGTGWAVYLSLFNITTYSNDSVDLTVCSFTLSGAASILVAINFICTIINKRAGSLPPQKLPLFVWSIHIIAFLLLLAILVLVYTVIMLLTDSNFTIFLGSSNGGDQISHQHLILFNVIMLYIYVIILSWLLAYQSAYHYKFRPNLFTLFAWLLSLIFGYISTILYVLIRFVEYLVSISEDVIIDKAKLVVKNLQHYTNDSAPWHISYFEVFYNKIDEVVSSSIVLKAHTDNITQFIDAGEPVLVNLILIFFVLAVAGLFWIISTAYFMISVKHVPRFSNYDTWEEFISYLPGLFIIMLVVGSEWAYIYETVNAHNAHTFKLATTYTHVYREMEAIRPIYDNCVDWKKDLLFEHLHPLDKSHIIMSRKVNYILNSTRDLGYYLSKLLASLSAISYLLLILIDDRNHAIPQSKR